jgi:hypothetical protein
VELFSDSISLRRKIFFLESKLRRQAVELAELRKYKRNTSSKSYKKHLVKGILSNSFSGPQANIIVHKKTRARKWSEEDIVNGLMLRSFSHKSYLFLRQKKLLPLPG